jgi:predicted N-acyltransferase
VLVAEGEDRRALVAAVVEAARALARRERMHALQVLFPDPEEAEELEAAGLALRVDFQYHWSNQGYAAPDDFLARFPSKRRNAIKRERRAPEEQGIAIRTVRGEELSRDPEGWARICFALHRRTTDRMVWGMRWVNQRFYERALSTMPDALEVVEARRDGRPIAMAFNVASAERLYGRYWGCSEEHPFLHFNVALYHSIDECIRRGVKLFEGGAGGEHKIARGFEPVETWSAHAFLDPRLDASVRRHVEQERGERLEAVRRWREEHTRLGG